MNKLSLIFILFLCSKAFGQIPVVKFREETFDNGMMYPQVIIVDNKEHEESINSNIKEHLADLKEQDFCIGQYGYVQKGSHLQVHVHANCIDFDESQNRYYLYNLESGQNVPYADMINPKMMGEAVNLLIERVKIHATAYSFAYDDSLELSIREKAFDALHCEMKRDGIDLWMGDGSWGEKHLFLTWIELKPVLKHHFI